MVQMSHMLADHSSRKPQDLQLCGSTRSALDFAKKVNGNLEQIIFKGLEISLILIYEYKFVEVLYLSDIGVNGMFIVLRVEGGCLSHCITYSFIVKRSAARM